MSKCKTCRDTWLRPYYIGDCSDPYHGKVETSEPTIPIGDQTWVKDGAKPADVQELYTDSNDVTETKDSDIPADMQSGQAYDKGYAKKTAEIEHMADELGKVNKTEANVNPMETKPAGKVETSEPDTHSACNARLKAEGKNAKCCECHIHQGCEMVTWYGQKWTKPADELERERIRAAIRKGWGVTDLDGTDMDEEADMERSVDAIQALITREVERELEPYTNLQDELDANHTKPCSICGELSHRCMCERAMMYVERKARDRIEQLKKGGSE